MRFAECVQCTKKKKVYGYSSKTMDSNDRCGMLGRVVLVVGWEKYQCKSSSSLINVESARRKKSICSTQVEYSIESASLYDIDSY